MTLIAPNANIQEHAYVSWFSLTLQIPHCFRTTASIHIIPMQSRSFDMPDKYTRFKLTSFCKQAYAASYTKEDFYTWTITHLHRSHGFEGRHYVIIYIVFTSISQTIFTVQKSCKNSVEQDLLSNHWFNLKMINVKFQYKNIQN